MPEAVSTNKRIPKVPTQQRSRERFEHILDCAETILEQGEIEEIAIYEVADKAELQAQSVYRLFPSAAAIVYALAQRYLDRMTEKLMAADYSQNSTWQGNLEYGLTLTREFYQDYPLAMELILGSSVSKDVRIADRANVTRLAENAIQNLQERSGGMAIPIEQLEISIDIVDAIWSQSYFSQGGITDFYFRESIRAATTYLELYLPRHIAGQS
ncbi:TetR/AcrR family transcriptional regulator [Pseudomaricurvus alkylphenolicus]|uniref:TetR/AcrR family transcriptional regulator n=1 Tax=Pseudomaricurvus alkylphenolicus TaxID=1306991 RepID=UPI0014245352|nr:TetR/AcrR family transcriptional regulator [Pseudomaricurvus alkylphenolicus]NIB42556.1 TetR/AcrR family transcriptional regulator [Pseudomaricurvus alkylphenolicus]